MTKGVCWSTATGPTISNTKTTNGSGTGSFASDISGLSPTTKYYVRAYATNLIGTAYGTEVSFTTPDAPVQLPVITTVSPGNITSISATSGGDISNDGGATITSRGVCWNGTGGATLGGNSTMDGSGSGTFASTLAGLAPNTKYYVRAYAVNAVGTAYGNEYSFTTLSASSAVLTTSSITSIAQTTASGGGNITSDGGAAITARGVCWSLNQNPTLADAFTVNDFGTGIFNSQLINLSPGRTYYVRAYATNSTGTTYGNQVSFLTASDIPKVTTSAVGTVTATTADVGGEVVDNNGSTTTIRGVCYNLVGSPTIGDNIKSESGGIGTFTMSLTGLTPNTNYYVRAFATNGVGTAYGAQVQVITPADIPTLTTNAISAVTTTTATSGGVITSDNGSTILVKGVCWSTNTGPVIGGTNQTNDGGSSSSFTSAITGLLPGTKYYVRAYATNNKGTGYGDEKDFTTNTIAPTIPGAPTIGLATKGNAQATVAFTAPVSDGGSAITGYTATSNPGGLTGTGTTSPITVSGLTNGTAYTFTVTATNGIGTGPASSASNSITPSTIPGAPVIGTATSGYAKATVSFTAPDDGGTFITGYTVTSNPGGITGTGGSSPIDVTGLANIAYTFTVTATNANGTGAASAPSNSVTPTLLPGAPTIGTATAGDAYASVTFTPPASDGGSAITVYKVTSNPGGILGTGVVSPINVTGLANGTAYTFTVTATNINGTGPASAASNSVTPSTVPGAPTIGTATAGNAQATITFTAPSSNGGSAITGYTVTSTPEGKTGTGSSSPVTVPGLTNGTAYTFKVTASNLNGTGLASLASNSVTPSTVPGAPTGVTAVKGNTSASVSFTAPSSNGGAAITGYTVTSNPSGFVGNGTSSPITVSGLVNGTTYTFTVTATNISGTGPASTASNSVIPSTTPTVTTTAVSSLTQTSAVSGGNVTSDGGAAISERGICYNTVTNPTTSNSKIVATGTTGAFTSNLTGLAIGTTYYVRAYAINLNGTVYGAVVSFTTPITTIGATYAGGLVFYIDATNLHGLVCASSDQSSSAQWGCSGTSISGADGTAVGTGNQNTIDIITGCTTAGIAAKICYDLSLSGYSDWFLPSRGELTLMYNNLHLSGWGGFGTGEYFSSSETGSTTVYGLYFGSNSWLNYYKNATLKVRAVRAF